MPDPTMVREMRELHAQLDVMETTHRWTNNTRDASEFENENEARPEEEEFVAEDVVEDYLFRVFARIGAK